MKIGIYMTYGPATVLGKEGLGRYIGNLIKGFVGAGHQVTIACPHWSLPAIDDLFQDFQISGSDVDFIVAQKSPILWRLYDRHKYKRYHAQSKLKVRLFRTAADVMNLGVNIFLSLSSVLLFVLACLAVLVLGIALLPLLLVACVAYFLARAAMTLLKKSKSPLRVVLQKTVGLMQTYSSQRIENLHTYLAQRRDDVISRDLVTRINTSDDQDVWFIPALFWPAVKDIKGCKVVCAPDMVTEEFAELFADIPSVHESANRCKEVLRAEKYFITYCEYLRSSLVIQNYGKPADCVTAIPHANNAMDKWVTIDPSLAKKLNAKKDFTQAFARSQLQVAKTHCASVDGRYLADFRFDDVHYIFYASQVRPHKNMLALIKAYEYLLRRRHVKVKLILTGDLSSSNSKELMEYIRSKRLEYDVLAFKNVTAQQLAALYCCADLVVNPTLYEGGFPFTFGEGMSVGTPSVMSDIPQTRDVTDRYGLSEEMLFDPYDWKSMAERIEYGLANKERMYQLQLPMYEDQKKRTSKVVAEEYIAAFEYFAAMDKGTK